MKYSNLFCKNVNGKDLQTETRGKKCALDALGTHSIPAYPQLFFSSARV